MQPTLAGIEAAAAIVYAAQPPTPQICWPLLCTHVGAEVWVKHENHTAIGAFKLRGGLVYFHHLLNSGARPAGVISATRGNHGQSVAAMRALGVELIEHGGDFQAAREHAAALAAQRGLHMVPSFHAHLVAGVATSSLEFLRAVPGLDVVYVPIGMGSGICGMVAVRDALGLATRVVGVVSSGAPAYALSFAASRPVEHAVTTLLADGMAVRMPDPAALDIMLNGVERMVEVTDEEVAAAMRMLFEDTHNVAEGAGAAALAAAVKDKEQLRGQRVGLVLSGGNIDRDKYAGILAEATRRNA